MHAFIRGKDVGFSAGKFYGGVADLLAGVEEDEGYVVDGRWVGWEGREERRKKPMESLTRTEETGSADIIRRSASDKERWRMEEVLRSTPSPPPAESSLCVSENEGPQGRDVALRDHVRLRDCAAAKK